MGTRTGVRTGSVFILLVIGSHLINVAHSSKVLDEVPFPEDLEATSLSKPQRYLEDDEDFAADEASGDLISGEEDGSTPEPPLVDPSTTIYYRALVNFTDSFVYGPELDDIESAAFQEISAAIVDTLESDYFRIPGTQTVNVVLIKQIGKDVFVELDVGSEDNSNEGQIRDVLFSVVSDGSIASYVTSITGFEFRRLGELKPSPSVPCTTDEFSCQTGACIPLSYVCDNRPDCPDLSDEINCTPDFTPPPIPIPSTTSEIKVPPRPGPCRADQFTCQNGQCVSRDYVCDGDTDCSDGSDEQKCGTPSPCEPNEFKCRNGRCALKLWRCDGDNDCHDNSDEIDCPAKKPGDVCAPEQFKCLSDQTCIPASYQCDEEPDCPDRSDEYGCAAPVVTSPPEESITATRGQTVTFTCAAVGVPIPIITWRLNWGHIPASNRISISSENGRGTLTIRDVKEGDQGAYTCEVINAKGLVFAIPDGVLTLIRAPSNCPDGYFSVDGRCVPCFCSGITKNCHSTGRYRSQISLRFTEEENFKGVNVSFPSRLGSPPPLSSTQMIANPEVEEFQLVDLSRRFLDLESYWTLPRQFLGSKVDSYGGYLRFQVSYLLQRDGSEPLDKPDVILRGNGNRLVYRRGPPTNPNVKNQREIKFTEENWHHSSGQPVTRTDLLMTLANLESISIRTIYNNRMASVGLSNIIMDTTTGQFSLGGQPRDVEECRCPTGYSGLSCESCSPSFERVPGGPYLGTCAGCNCHNHASACDPVSGHCLSCQHNTEGPQCDKCRPGYFGDPSRGRPDDCKPCPCPYIETSRRFSDSCFLDVDGQATCDACAPGYTGRRCEKCASGYVGSPLQPNGKCLPYSEDYTRCDNKGTISSSSRPCNCKANVAGALCNECKPGAFHLSGGNPDGCLQCFCMGVTKECASSTWTRDQVRSGVNDQLFSLASEGNNRIITTEGHHPTRVIHRAGSEIFYRTFDNIPNDIYYWVLPENFRGDKVTAYGGELRYKVRYEPRARSVVIENKPDVVLQGNSIFLEHYSQTKTLPRVPATFVVPFRESAWRRADGQPCTREHLLMALADVSLFMIRATYADNMAESSIADIQMDIAVPHSTGSERALEVEECACPQGYRGPSCQDCEVGYTRTGSGLYLGTCEKCECHGHASGCDAETGACLQCQHNTAGPRCEKCELGFFGDPVTSGIHACRPCPCFGAASGSSETKSCYLDRDGHPTCSCPVGYTGRRCERCSPGYTGNPEHGQGCIQGSGTCQNCDNRGSEGCSSNGICQCKMNVEGPSCSGCKPATFHLSPANKDGCLACFCMGVTQQCSSSSLYRDVITTVFAPGNTQGFALVNRQRTNRISNGFSVEVSNDGTQLSFTNFNQHSQEPHFWQLPSSYQGDKSSSSDVHKLDDEIWKLISNFSQGPPASLFSSSSGSTSSFPVRTSSSVARSGAHAPIPPLLPSGLQASVWASGPHLGAPGHSPYHTTLKDKLRKNTVEPSSADSSNKYSLVYKGFSLHSEDVLFWKLPEKFHGNKVEAYGGKLKYTISYVPGPRGAPITDVDVQIIGNDITLVARQDWRRGLGTRETHQFEFIFREEHWQRPDGMPATREHLLMVLADLDDVLIRASYHTFMRSSSISGLSMEIAVPHDTGLEQALDVEQCRCPPGYQGLSCQDCTPGYTRTGGGLYLGHCELCDCYGHSDSCHPETGACMSCQHNTMGDLCEQCAAGFFGYASTGTPEDCQPCACPHTDPENQFSPTCESLGNGDHQCTGCQPGYTGQYCERCAPGYVGNPQQRVKCRPYDAAASLVVRVYPERVQVSQGSSVTLRCQGSGPPPHYFYWTRDDGRPISSSAERRRQGEELHFSSVQSSDAGVYTCTCRNQLNTNRSRAEIVITTSPSKPIEVFIEEPKSQHVIPGATVNFICTAKSKFPAYTLVWTRQGNGKLPDRAMDFNGILTIRNVRPEDAGVYVCTGSNMFAMDEGNAVLYVPDGTKAEMFYTAYEMFEGHRQPGEVTKPTVTIHPSVLTVKRGQRAEFRCTTTGSPAPTVEWAGGPGNHISSRAIIRGGVLTFPSVQRSDEGDYNCRAVNTHGEHTARAALYVYSSPAHEVVKPTVMIHPPVLRAKQGTQVEFYCSATGNPAPSIEWTGGPGNRISGSAVIRGGVLTFPSVERSDEGDYTCRAFNTHGEHAARAVLQVQGSSAVEVMKPSVTIQSPVLTVQHGQRAELRCSATGNPAPSIEWTGPGNRISSSAVIRGEVLIIPSVERSDEGEYTCRASNTHGEHAAQLVLYIQGSSAGIEAKPSVTIQSPVLTVQQGQRAELRCSATGNPAPSIEWTGPGNRISSSAVIRGEVLIIPSVERSDEGEYTCRASNTHGEHAAQLVLYIQDSSAGIEAKPSVTIQSPVLTVQQGQRAELRCSATGNPAPSIEWTGPGNRISSSAIIRGEVLIIPSVERSDEGEYTCRASNTHGEHAARLVLYIQGSSAGIEAKPSVTIQSPVLTVQQGQRAELRCSATGNPAPSIEWTGPGNRISSSAIIRGEVLIIPSVERSDEGEYTCRASNTHGEHAARLVLHIQGSSVGIEAKPSVTIQSPVITIQQGQRAELRCSATGNPAPSIEWTGPGNRISSSAIIRGEVLIIPSVERSDEGEYTCRASNTHGEHAARLVLYIQGSSAGIEAKPSVTIQSPVLTVQQGQRAELRCSATGNPAPSIEWTGPGNRISSSAIIRGEVLIIPSVERSDEGEYTCRASNTHGEHAAQLVLYIQGSSAGIEAKPSVTIQSPVITIQQGQPAEFRCSASGNPAPSLEWTGGPGNRISSSAIIQGGVLTFPSVQRSDEGIYTCRAVNTHGEHAAQAVLYVHSASLPHVQVSPQRVEIHEGDTLRLYCRAGGSPRPELKWKKRGGAFPPQAIPSHGFHQYKSNSLDALQRRIDEMQARTERTDYGTLLVPDMKISDAGTYLCIGINAVGSSEAVIDVTVIKGETVQSDVTIQSAASTVVQGETLELKCVVQGDPPPSVIWSRANGLGLSSNHQVVGSKLRILQATPDDSGEYICRVYGGPSSRQATIYVSVTSEAVRHQSPIISIEPHSVIVKKGESASFKCRLHTGAQPVRLEWKLSTNEPLQGNVVVSSDGSVLAVSDAQPVNQGAYRCVASNPYGVTHSIASLIVRELPKATVTPTGPVRVNVGEPINLECQAAGEPRPSVTWHRLDKNRRTILSSPVPMESNAVMQVLAARPEDSGTYICTAQNSQGKSETRLEVIVEGGTQTPTAPRAFVREPLLVVVEGATTVLHCDAHGFPKPTITWSKLRAPLPWRHKIVNNSLVLPSVGRQDSGQYICNATNSVGTSEITVMVDVETPPYTTTLPDDVAVRVGEVIRLQCLAHGTPPMRFEWTKVDGRLPARAEVQGGDLQVNLASPSDAGTYKCVASNKVGKSEAVAKVSVRSPLSVRVSPQVEVKALGSAVEFTCSASGGPDISVEWLKEGGTLPHNHHIKDGVLRIENLEKSNEGMYICRATTLFGQAQDTAKLTIQALPKVMINVRTSVQTVTVGTSVEFECHAEGDPVPTVRWSKVGAPLPDHVQVKGAMLRIERVTEADAGQYRCTATNNVGSVQSQVVLNIQSLPQIAAQPDTKEVTVGSTAMFPCIATGYPAPNITWSKLENELPPKCTQDADVLTVPNVTHEDSGTYVCTASNKQGKVQAFTKLSVHERVMPYFSQEPLSYLKLPTIKNSYKAFKIQITFRPDNVDGLVLYSGMILYNGQRKSMGADFISLGLVGGRPEFRFDVGSGMATIRYPTAIKLGEFHTVQLYRNGTQGSITVDNQAPVNGTSQGKFQGLDLNEELFVGGYPNYSMIAKTAELNSGFVGCVSQLIIQGDEVIFKDLDRSSTGVTNCPTCKDHPCQNGGVCRDSVSSLYKCGCRRGFTGSNCQHLSSEHCHPEACGPDATCINRPSGVGYDCRCHLGKYGHKCMDGTLVTTPLFDSDQSYIAYPPLTNIHNDLRIDMEFKPMDEDGLMFFIGGKKMKVEDFVTLSLVAGHVEFRYELGTGQAILRSQEQVSIGQWHHVTAERFNQDGLLKLDDGPEVKRSSPGKAQGLNVHTSMFLGGVPARDILPKPANVSTFFEGCIGEVSINGKKMDLSYTFTDSRSISQCVDASPCDRRPCQHGGTCMPTAEYEFQCLCRDGYEGEHCEVVRDTCLDSSECHNGGGCVDGRCVCAAGYTGVFCREGQEAVVQPVPWNLEGSGVNDSPIQYAAYFHDDGYLSLPKLMFPRSAPESPETIELEMNTLSADGLILWQGVESGEQGKGKDFISLGLQNGQLVFSYQLGSGEAEILSTDRINDGHWHKITAVRTGKQGYIQVDERAAQHGQSPGRSLMVNTIGSIYLGGAPDVIALTGGKFSSGVTGCVKNLSLLNARPGEQPSRPIDLQLHAEDGKNVRRCSS